MIKILVCRIVNIVETVSFEDELIVGKSYGIW
jgi:hypothetical protein